MREVKYSRFIFLIIGVLILIGILISSTDMRYISLGVDTDGILQVELGREEILVKSWEKEGVHYFFIPSYIEGEKLRYEEGSIELNGLLVENDKITVPWNEVSTLTLKNNEMNIWQGQICFMRSENVPSLYVNVEDVDALNSDKDIKLPAEMTLIETDGSINYQGAMEYITGRGNTTWYLDKKTYTLKLTEAYPLLGMNNNKKWVLLANGYEGSKIMYKMTMDIASQMGLDYVPQMTWVDLYVNGEYQGNYLLSEKIMVGDGSVEIEDLNTPNEMVQKDEVLETFVDNYYKGYETNKNPENITGGYLIEKDYLPYYGKETCGFFTNRLQPFTIKHPSVATRAEVDYIWSFVTTIDNLMAERDERLLQFIDRESFYRKFILDEIALNSDSNITSAYFYKHRNENILYAGPPWDYDGVYGESNGIWMDYTQTILDINTLRESEELALDWNNVLYSFDECKHEIIAEYERVLPLYEYYLNEGIDECADYIHNSVQMDLIRWEYGKNQAGHYDDYENTIKYLKYFIANRLNWLNSRWEIDTVYEMPKTSNELHDISVSVGEEKVFLQIEDGQCLKIGQLPELTDEYSGYVYQRDGQAISEYLPIYEDQVIVAVRREE